MHLCHRSGRVCLTDNRVNGTGLQNVDGTVDLRGDAAQLSDGERVCYPHQRAQWDEQQ